MPPGHLLQSVYSQVRRTQVCVLKQALMTCGVQLTSHPVACAGPQVALAMIADIKMSKTENVAASIADRGERGSFNFFFTFPSE
jgi:hypothetical protein